MKLKEIMTSGVEVVQPEASLTQAAEKMKSLDVGSLPVCNGDYLLGMITDRDIVTRAIAEGRDPQQTPVKDAMTGKVVYCFEDDNVEEAAQKMKDQQIRRLPILSADKKLVGIVALGDLAVDTGRERMSGETLTEISKPAQPER